ncbi:hypothetical protein V6N11_004703 [Hibiscus sabdariffa]|uniref:Pentatricopeptide repeat-containing protein n=1 Tax=Hibiscus sabdariffa TaxID=183260 RepID=A0ABR2SHN3_9ROSI
MGNLISSLILPTVVNGGRNLSTFHSSLSPSVTRFATHFKSLSKKYMSLSGKGKKYDAFHNVDDALNLFDKMIGMYPKPSIVEFNKLLAAIVRMKHYAIVVSLCTRMELLGVSLDVYSFNILINCFCQLGRVDFGYSVLGGMLKLGVEPDIVTFSTLINGLCRQSKISQAVSLFDELVEKWYQPDLIVYSTLLNGLCKIGSSDKAVRFLRMMEGRGFKPNIVAYCTVIDCPCKHGVIKEALDLFSEVKVKGHQTKYRYLQLPNSWYVYFGPAKGGNKAVE